MAPLAAALLLNATRELCNPRGQDYVMQDLCAAWPNSWHNGHHVRCTLPPRGLSRSGTQGWGLFVQNARVIPSYNRIINGARGRTVASNWTVAGAQQWERCAAYPLALTQTAY